MFQPTLFKDRAEFLHIKRTCNTRGPPRVETSKRVLTFESISDR